MKIEEILPLDYDPSRSEAQVKRLREQQDRERASRLAIARLELSGALVAHTAASIHPEEK